MKEQRYNAFNQIHKGLRGLLYDTAQYIQKTDFETAEAKNTIEKVQLVVDLFDEHAHHEDAHILPMVLKYNPQMVENFEKDHVLDHKLSEDLRSLCLSWLSTTSQDDKIMIGQSLFYAFNEFIAFNLYHMNREEHELLLTLWQYYTDEELLNTTQTIVQSIKPETLLIESKWMMRNLNNIEIIQWMSGIKMSAPLEVFESYVRMAQEELPKSRWTAISTLMDLQLATA